MFEQRPQDMATTTCTPQPGGWRFVPNAILPGHRWHPQWFPEQLNTAVTECTYSVPREENVDEKLTDEDAVKIIKETEVNNAL